MPFAPTLAQLRAFVAVAEVGHFRDAAADAGVSQSALSQALATLESGIGSQLIERTTRRVLVTPEGERLLAGARAVLDAADSFLDAAGAARPPLTGALRVGVIPTVAPYLLPSALRTLRRRAPLLRPQVSEDQTERLLAGLRSGAVDVAVLAVPTGETGFTEIPLYDEDFVLVLPPDHALCGAEDVPTSALREIELLLLGEGHCLRDQTLEVCRRAQAEWAAVTSSRASSLSTIVQLVAAGLGSTMLPESALAVEARRGGAGGGLGLARFAAPVPGRRIGLVHRTGTARHGEYVALAGLLRDAGRAARLPIRFVQ